MSRPTLAFGAPKCSRSAPVDVRPAPARPSRAVDLDERVAHVHRASGRSGARRRRVVHRRAVEIRDSAPVEARVEVDQLGDDPARRGPAPRSRSVCASVISARCVTSRPTIVMSSPLREDALRGLRVGPDVELGRRRAVALADRAAHQDDPLRPRVGVQREQQRRCSSAARSGRASACRRARGSRSAR